MNDIAVQPPEPEVARPSPADLDDAGWPSALDCGMLGPGRQAAAPRSDDWGWYHPACGAHPRPARALEAGEKHARKAG